MIQAEIITEEEQIEEENMKAKITLTIDHAEMRTILQNITDLKQPEKRTIQTIIHKKEPKIISGTPQSEKRTIKTIIQREELKIIPGIPQSEKRTIQTIIQTEELKIIPDIQSQKKRLFELLSNKKNGRSFQNRNQSRPIQKTKK